MQQAPRSCEDKDRLREAYVAALGELVKATGELRWAQYGRDFQDALEKTQSARSQYESARRALEDHRKEHGC